MEKEKIIEEKCDTNNNTTVDSLIKKILDDVFFVQNRIWEWWETFDVYKVRTMQKNSDENVPESVLKWDKKSWDSRIIDSRKWMRKTWVDEMPQIINILKWEMWFFWSRPMDTQTHNQLSNTQKDRRSKYRPWIFGWYAFVDKWNKSSERTLRENQDIYLRLRYLKEKQGNFSMVKFNCFIFLENIKFILSWKNR